MSSTSVVTALKNYHKDYDKTLEEAWESVEKFRTQEKIIKDLMKENKLLQQINNKVQGNFNDLVRERSNLSAEHQAEMSRLGEAHATSKLDIVQRMCFSSRQLFSESFLSEEKNFYLTELT